MNDQRELRSYVQQLRPSVDELVDVHQPIGVLGNEGVGGCECDPAIVGHERPALTGQDVRRGVDRVIVPQRFPGPPGLPGGHFYWTTTSPRGVSYVTCQIRCKPRQPEGLPVTAVAEFDQVVKTYSTGLLGRGA